ncbi:hypothetical protein ACHMXJ_24235 [Pseudomonas aeruginosa]
MRQRHVQQGRAVGERQPQHAFEQLLDPEQQRDGGIRQFAP